MPQLPGTSSKDAPSHVKPGGADPQPQVSKWLAKVTVCTVSSGRTDRSYLWGCRGGSGEHYSLNTNSLSWVVFASHMLTSLRSARDRLDGVNKSQDLASVNYSLSLSHTHTHTHSHTHTHTFTQSQIHTHIHNTHTHLHIHTHTHTHSHSHTHSHAHTCGLHPGTFPGSHGKPPQSTQSGL